MTEPFVLRWGIVGSGGISGKFVRDLCMDPAARKASDIHHAVTVVGAREVKRAQTFVEENAPKGGWAQQTGLYKDLPKAVGDYNEVYNSPEVDIVYIGTVHPAHFQNTKAALEAGKGVLVEKPATLNAKETKILVELAKEKKLFFMEGVWTRFFPLTIRFQELLHKEKAIGDVHFVQSDFGMGFWHTVDKSHRVFNPELGGSAQLDIGPYSLLWGLLALQEHPDNKGQAPSKVTATSLPDPRTGVDLFTSIILDYKNLKARAQTSCNNMISGSPLSCVSVMGTEGELLVGGAISARPEYIILRKYKGKLPLKSAKEYEETREDFPLQGTGLNYEADAVARAVRDGKFFCERCPPATTILTMELLDEWRKQTDFKYPEGQEQA